MLRRAGSRKTRVRVLRWRELASKAAGTYVPRATKLAKLAASNAGPRHTGEAGVADTSGFAHASGSAGALTASGPLASDDHDVGHRHVASNVLGDLDFVVRHECRRWCDINRNKTSRRSPIAYDRTILEQDKSGIDGRVGDEGRALAATNRAH